MPPFQVVSDYQPAGDQPRAIEKLAQGIDGVSSVTEQKVFDLSGRRITSSVLPRGIYIINGKKTMIR